MARKTKQDQSFPESVRKNWVFPDRADDRHGLYGSNDANIAHESNNIDHGFGIARPAVLAAAPAAEIFPPIPEFDNRIQEAKHIDLIEKKLTIVRRFIHKENELGLAPNRRMDKDPVAVELSKGMIMLTFRTQAVIRDLVNLRPRLIELANDQEKNADELQTLMADFLWAWKELRGVLAFLVPGPTEVERLRRAEVVMTNVLGENIVVEEQVGEVEKAVDGVGGMNDAEMDVDGQ
jgi:hypothetical protein